MRRLLSLLRTTPFTRPTRLHVACPSDETGSPRKPSIWRRSNLRRRLSHRKAPKPPMWPLPVRRRCLLNERGPWSICTFGAKAPQCRTNRGQASTREQYTCGINQVSVPAKSLLHIPKPLHTGGSKSAIPADRVETLLNAMFPNKVSKAAIRRHHGPNVECLNSSASSSMYTDTANLRDLVAYTAPGRTNQSLGEGILLDSMLTCCSTKCPGEESEERTYKACGDDGREEGGHKHAMHNAIVLKPAQVLPPGRRHHRGARGSGCY
jgi:hypothetical protein